MKRPARRASRLRGLVTAPVVLAALLPGCSDDGGESDKTPAQVLAAAKTTLDDTSGVALSLAAEELPAEVDGVREATGVATHAPAFDGDLTLVVNGLDVDVRVVSVDGTVYARFPFTDSFAEVVPADYGAPDPAQLMDRDTGLSSWLTAATGIEEGERVRDGDLMLSSYSGTLDGEVVDASIPSARAAADFPVTFRIDEDGRLRSVEVFGPFYGPKGMVDYLVNVDDYGTDPDITRP